jgi:hypothetical protein
MSGQVQIPLRIRGFSANSRMRRASLLMSAAWVLGAACGGGGGDATGPKPVDNTPAGITLSPSSAITLVSGTTTNITATVTAKDGRTIFTNVSWTADDPAVVSVALGSITAVKVGTTNVTARAGTVSASISITVTPGSAFQLGLRTQPLGATIGGVLAAQPVVEIRDAAGNLVSTASATVTAALASGGGTLSGVVSVPTVGGVATFTNLGVSGVAGVRTMSFTASGLVGATSNQFTMAPPPTPVISLDKNTVTFATRANHTPTAATVTITNPGAQPLVGMTIDPVAYGNGEQGGWLVPILTSVNAPTVMTLGVNMAGVSPGTYHATVRLNGPGAPNSPAAITVTMLVVQDYDVTFGTSLEKVHVLDVGDTFSPTFTVANPSGQPVSGIAVTTASRSPSVATVSADGKITAKSAGDAWIVALSDFSSDSIFVVVAASKTAPIIRTELASYLGKIGDTMFVNVVLDTRGTTIGAARLDADVSFLPGTVSTVATPGAAAPVFTTTSGVVHISIASATGLTGVVKLVTVKVISRSAGSGLIFLYALDASGIDGSNMTSQVQSTRVPVVIR